MSSRVRGFAEDKDQASKLRDEILRPELERGRDVAIDFSGVDLATQSFVHALVSDLIRDPGLDALDHLIFKSCNTDVKTIVSIVVDYSQENVAASDSLP